MKMGLKTQLAVDLLLLSSVIALIVLLEAFFCFLITELRARNLVAWQSKALLHHCISQNQYPFTRLPFDFGFPQGLVVFLASCYNFLVVTSGLAFSGDLPF